MDLLWGHCGSTAYWWPPPKGGGPGVKMVSPRCCLLMLVGLANLSASSFLWEVHTVLLVGPGIITAPSCGEVCLRNEPSTVATTLCNLSQNLHIRQVNMVQQQHSWSVFLSWARTICDLGTIANHPSPVKWLMSIGRWDYRHFKSVRGLRIVVENVNNFYCPARWRHQIPCDSDHRQRG